MSPTLPNKQQPNQTINSSLIIPKDQVPRKQPKNPDPTHTLPPSHSPEACHPPTLIQHLNHPTPAFIRTPRPSANPITSPAHPEAPQSQPNKLPATSELPDPALAPHTASNTSFSPGKNGNLTQPASVPHKALSPSEEGLAQGPQEVEDSPAPQEALILCEGVQATNGPLAPASQETVDSPAPCEGPKGTNGPLAPELLDTSLQEAPAPQEALVPHEGSQAAKARAIKHPLDPALQEAPAPQEAQTPGKSLDPILLQLTQYIVEAEKNHVNEEKDETETEKRRETHR
ncbi:hypothetical protein PGT21_033895 [Puccinia graminis f. sp. tritici]|uniref:Uncharacterized protein n=1 Tax=Puccinia graminis f. sp. tritici TaxID=56615 RepID=A0A5B0M864_PUCGR|nr:hypothetical protein PGTUg99_026112 [Puccinia graminis f. sp. tritici]KAA1075334.1 hypothetical protein PGT21_033895 [Puccinia graminis f. sp. tritici]